MALSIKTDEADRLARDLAAATHESLTEAVTTALRERLQRVQASGGASMSERLALLSAQYRALDVADHRSPDEILGYDKDGLPR